MNFVHAVRSGFLGYATFSGRAGVGEFWYWILFIFVLRLFCGVLDLALTGDTTSIFSLLFWLVIPPTVSVTVRRQHDTDRSGWWYFLFMVPIVGWFFLIGITSEEGTAGSNNFGPEPSGAQPG